MGRDSYMKHDTKQALSPRFTQITDVNLWIWTC